MCHTGVLAQVSLHTIGFVATVRTRRDERERELVAATRRLFDEHGLQHAPVEEIAREVGIARGLIYRHFASKEELYVLTVTDYLGELEGDLSAVSEGASGAAERAEALMRCYAAFCLRYPAFLDCSLSLMQRPARQLRAAISETVWLRLGQSMAVCLEHVSETVRQGVAEGIFAVGDVDLATGVLWTQVLGTMHLARVGVSVRQLAPGVPDVFRVDDQAVVEQCVRSALATLRAG